jgi:hypothetical protein
MASDIPSIPRQLPPQPVVICDPLHLLKRIRYRWVTEGFSLLTRAGVFLSHSRGSNKQVIFRQLFSAMAKRVKCRIRCRWNCYPGEVMIMPWCLLLAALTLPNVSTRIKLGCLEVGFWFLSLHRDARCSPTLLSSRSSPPVAVRLARPK